MPLKFPPRPIPPFLFLLALLVTTGCTKIRRHGEMTCYKEWSLLWSVGWTECSIKNVPLRRGKPRTFAILTNNIIPNALQVSLQGIRPGFHAWRDYLEKAEAVTLDIEFVTLEGAPLISKQVYLADARRELGPPHQTHAGIRDYANFEILDWKEHSNLYSDLLEETGYKVRVEILEDGSGGKREGKLLYDYWLHRPNRHTNFSGTISRGETFRRPFDEFEFALEPTDHAWIINVYEQGREGSLSIFTLPLYGPNPTSVEGWHFRNAANTGPNTGELNFPQEFRAFNFSPEVGRTIQPPDTTERLNIKEANRIAQYGRGFLEITSIDLSPPIPGGTAHIERMSFRCQLEDRN
mgnify:CR=1 FL=1